jgi:hypothetical protein
MEKEQIAYLAGVFDGEGSFGIWSKGKKKAPNFRATVEMQDVDTIMKFMVYFKAGTIMYIEPRKEHFKSLYRWKIDSDKAVKVVREMLPYLSRRRQSKFQEDLRKLDK